METLHAHQLDEHKAMLDRIESEYQEYETLKEKLEDLNKQLIAVSLLTRQEFLNNYISRVKVKLHYESDPKVINYHVYVYLSKLFKDKMTNIPISFRICVYNSQKFRFISTYYEKNTSFDSDVVAIIPFDTSTKATVEVRIEVSSIRINIPIAKILVDLRYHFCQKETQSICQELQIAKLYHPDIDDFIKKPQILKYQIPFHSNIQALFKLLFENSYHNVNIRENLTCSTINNVNTIHLNTSRNTLITIKFVENEKKLYLEAPREEMMYLKKLIFNQLHNYVPRITKLCYAELKVGFYIIV